MPVSVAMTNGVCRVMIEGEMNIYNASAIKDHLLNAISECPRIELDLFNVNEIDTSGIQLLIMLNNEAQRRHRELNITMNNAVRNVMKLLNIEIGEMAQGLCR